MRTMSAAIQFTGWPKPENRPWTKDAIEGLSAAKESVNNCTDSTSPSAFVIPNHPVSKAFRGLKERGIRSRFIAEITKDNIGFVMKYSRLNA
jgi:hypothetical protein